MSFVQKYNQNGYGILGIIFVIIELMFVLAASVLVIAFILQLFGANPSAPFAQWIYGRMTDLMKPFNGIFPEFNLVAKSRIELSILFGAFIYGLIAGFFGLFTRKIADGKEVNV